MAHLNKPKNAGCRQATALHIQRTTSADRSVWRRIIAQLSHTAPRTGKQKLAAEKPLEIPIPPHYFAFRDRN
jgi:hypothetical protein